MCQLQSHKLSCCGHIDHKEVLTRCSSWLSPCAAFSEDVAVRVLADCPSCRQDRHGRAAAVTREYNAREAAILKDAKKMGWEDQKTFEMSLKISEDLEAALKTLVKLEGGKGR